MYYTVLHNIVTLPLGNEFRPNIQAILQESTHRRGIQISIPLRKGRETCENIV